MKLVGISSCPTGIAHTYMAAEAMQKEAKKHGIKMKVEMQGQMGPKNVISQKEFNEADAIVLCCGVHPLDEERFVNLKDKTVSIDYNTVVKKPSIMIDALVNAGLMDRD